MQKIVAIVQARMNSVRLPGKSLKLINNTPAIEILYKRLSKSKYLNQVVFATSSNKKNIPLINFFKKKNVSFYVGDDTNVLRRFYKSAVKFNVDIIKRITK
mgnify:FL=1